MQERARERPLPAHGPVRDAERLDGVYSTVGIHPHDDAGLALANALAIALRDEPERIAATVTFAVTASGITVAGVGSAFWGLAAGLVVLFLDRRKFR